MNLTSILNDPQVSNAALQQNASLPPLQQDTPDASLQPLIFTRRSRAQRLEDYKAMLLKLNDVNSRRSSGKTAARQQDGSVNEVENYRASLSQTAAHQQDEFENEVNQSMRMISLPPFISHSQVSTLPRQGQYPSFEPGDSSQEHPYHPYAHIPPSHHGLTIIPEEQFTPPLPVTLQKSFTHRLAMPTDDGPKPKKRSLSPLIIYGNPFSSPPETANTKDSHSAVWKGKQKAIGPTIKVEDHQQARDEPGNPFSSRVNTKASCSVSKGIQRAFDVIKVEDQQAQQARHESGDPFSSLPETTNTKDSHSPPKGKKRSFDHVIRVGDQQAQDEPGSPGERVGKKQNPGPQSVNTPEAPRMDEPDSPSGPVPTSPSVPSPSSTESFSTTITNQSRVSGPAAMRKCSSSTSRKSCSPPFDNILRTPLSESKARNGASEECFDAKFLCHACRIYHNILCSASRDMSL